ncbi:MAG: hypothetical protein M1608_13015, partial [Candidatus Omnitrophica bacterium]|nr:hypothetical protein [Candidatus Omnitrophota bacterium]
EPFRSWKNSAWFWAKTAEVPGPLLSDPNAWNSNGSSIDGIFGAMIDSKQVHKLPVPWLLALLVAYLALIGPVDRFWLRRINRQMLTWITFPIYVVLFSGLIYFIGYKLRAGESEWNELHVVDIVPRGANTDLRGRTYMSIYSPVNAKYPLASDVPFSTMRAEAQWLGSADAGSVRIDQQVHGFRATVDVPVWTSQLYVNDWWQPSAPPLSAQVVPRGTGFQVTVHNYLNRNLSRACLVLNGRVFELGLLPAQQIKSFDLDMAKGRRLLDFFANYSVDFTQAVQQRRRAFGGESTARNWDVPACVMAASFVPQIELGRQFSGGYSGGFLAPDGFDLTPLAQRGDAILLTWDAGHSLIQSIAKFDPRRSQRDTLFRLAVTVEKPAL